MSERVLYCSFFFVEELRRRKKREGPRSSLKRPERLAVYQSAGDFISQREERKENTKGERR